MIAVKINGDFVPRAGGGVTSGDVFPTIVFGVVKFMNIDTKLAERPETAAGVKLPPAGGATPLESHQTTPADPVVEELVRMSDARVPKGGREKVFEADFVIKVV